MPFRAASCSNQTERVRTSSARRLERNPGFFFFKPHCWLHPSLSVSKPRNPPHQKLLRRKTPKPWVTFRSQSRRTPQHFAPSNIPKMMGLSSKPLRSLGPDVQSSYHSLLAVAPSFSSTLLHPCIQERSSSSSFLRCDSRRPQPGLSPSHLLLFLPLQQPLAASLCKLDHQRHTTRSQWIINTDIDLGKNVCKFLKGNQEQGAGRFVGDDAAELNGGARKQDRFWIPKFGQLRGDGYRNACRWGCARERTVLCSLISLQLLSPKNQEPHGREPPSTPCLGCGPALFCFHYHTLLCNLHKYRVIFYRVAQKIEPGKKQTLCCVQEGLAAYSSRLRICLSARALGHVARAPEEMQAKER